MYNRKDKVQSSYHNTVTSKTIAMLDYFGVSDV